MANRSYGIGLAIALAAVLAASTALAAADDLTTTVDPFTGEIVHAVSAATSPAPSPGGNWLFGSVCSVEPFTGDRSDSFETQGFQNWQHCVINGRVFQDTADICNTDPSRSTVWINTNIGSNCSYSRGRTGSYFLFGFVDQTQIIFDNPVSQFGGYFGNPWLRTAGEARFFDENDLPIATKPMTFEGSCQWTWNGWRVCSGPLIKRIELQVDNGLTVLWDDLEVIDGGEVCNPCDTNCDGEINAFDIEPFIDLLFDPNEDPCCGSRGDANSSGDVNGDGEINSFDIEPFVACLFP